MKINNLGLGLSLQAGQLASAAVTPPIGNILGSKPTVFDMAIKAGLEELNTVIAFRQQQMEALPEKLQHTVFTLISKEYQAALIKDAGFTNLASASKTVGNELLQLISSLKDNPDVLPLDVNYEWTSHQPSTKQKILHTLYELTATFTKSEGTQSTSSHGASSLSFFLPLQFENQSRPYPASIQIYREQAEEKPLLSASAKELWLRICLQTENLGSIETVFRLHNNSLDIRVSGNENTSAKFCAEELQETLRDLQLPIGLIAVKSG